MPKLFAHYAPIMATHIKRNASNIEIYNEDKLIKTLDSGLAIGMGAGDITYQIRGEK